MTNTPATTSIITVLIGRSLLIIAGGDVVVVSVGAGVLSGSKDVGAGVKPGTVVGCGVESGGSTVGARVETGAPVCVCVGDGVVVVVVGLAVVGSRVGASVGALVGMIGGEVGAKVGALVFMQPPPGLQPRPETAQSSKVQRVFMLGLKQMPLEQGLEGLIWGHCVSFEQSKHSPSGSTLQRRPSVTQL